MAWDIYGNPLKRGHCEVHPHIGQEYPCSVCLCADSGVQTLTHGVATPRQEGTITAKQKAEWARKGFMACFELNQVVGVNKDNVNNLADLFAKNLELGED